MTVGAIVPPIGSGCNAPVAVRSPSPYPVCATQPLEPSMLGPIPVWLASGPVAPKAEIEHITSRGLARASSS